MSDPDQKRGLYEKYIVVRHDGSSRPGGKHETCRYHVLDLEHDRFAGPALRAYADACEAEYPDLARDLRAMFPAPEPAPGPGTAEYLEFARGTPAPEPAPESEGRCPEHGCILATRAVAFCPECLDRQRRLTQELIDEAGRLIDKASRPAPRTEGTTTP